MLKNTASQVIGAQMVSAADGSAFTGSVTCYVTGNGGTQAAGSVGSGVCTHEGNGFHTYTPSQAETNYDHVAFTFTGTGAVPVTIQVYPGTAPVTAPTNFSSMAIDANGRVQVQVGTSAGQISASSGIPNVNVAQISTDATAADNLEAYCDGTTPQPVNVTQFGGSAGSFASGRPAVNTSHIAGAAVSTTTAQIGVNVVQVSGDATAADNLESYCDGTTPQPVNVTQISGDATAADNLESYVDGTDRIPVDVKEVNSVALQGAGTLADPWEPA